MKVTDLIVEVRNASLARVGQLLPKDLEGFTAVLRFNSTGTWAITLPADHVLVDSLRAPGAGLIVTGPSFSFSGPTLSAKRSQTSEDPVGSWSISGSTDDIILGERLAYPTPTTASVTAQTSDYDVRTGKASTVLFGYVNANIGPSAPAARKLSTLSLGTDPAIGSTITASARFEPLGKLLTRLAAIDGLGFTIRQSASGLVFSVYQPTDRSAYVRMDIENNLLSKSEYTYTAPEATRAIVAGSGEGTLRTFAEVTTTASTDAETAWGRRIEVFKDQRSDSDPALLAQAGTEELAEKGKTLEAVSVSPSDDVTMAFGTDWFLGDKVSVVAGSTTIVQIVTEVGFKISEDGVRIGATVGNPSTADDDSTVADVQTNQEERISNLERNTAGGENSVTTDSIADSSVTGTKIADGSITSAKIADGTIVNADISASAGIATSKISGLDSALASKAPIASPTLTGTVTAPTIRLTDETDVSLASTGHALQIGPSSGTNLVADGNEIQARNNGAASVLNLNIEGGNVTIGDATSTVNVSGKVNATLGGETIVVKGPSGVNAYLAFYKGGSATRTGYIGHGSASNSAITISADTDACSLALGNDGSPRIYSTDIYNRTYSTNPTVCVTTAGTLGRISSASKYKLDIEEKAVDEEKILALKPKTWLDRSLYEKNQAYLALVEAGEDVSAWEGYSPDWEQPRVPGLIAEDLVQAGLEEYVFYGEPDENGNREVEGIQYDRAWIELIPVVQRQRDEISELRSAVAALTQRVETLEGKK